MFAINYCRKLENIVPVSQSELRQVRFQWMSEESDLILGIHGGKM